MNRQQPSPRQVPDSELLVMKLLWQRGAQTTKDIRQELYPGGTRTDFGTVQKLLERLEKKGYITRDRSAYAHVFSAKVSQEQYSAEQLQVLADKLSDGSLVPLIMNAVKGNKLSAKARRTLREFLDDLS